MKAAPSLSKDRLLRVVDYDLVTGTSVCLMQSGALCFKFSTSSFSEEMQRELMKLSANYHTVINKASSTESFMFEFKESTSLVSAKKDCTFTLCTSVSPGGDNCQFTRIDKWLQIHRHSGTSIYLVIGKIISSVLQLFTFFQEDGYVLSYFDITDIFVKWDRFGPIEIKYLPRGRYIISSDGKDYMQSVASLLCCIESPLRKRYRLAHEHYHHGLFELSKVKSQKSMSLVQTGDEKDDDDGGPRVSSNLRRKLSTESNNTKTSLKNPVANANKAIYSCLFDSFIDQLIFLCYRWCYDHQYGSNQNLSDEEGSKSNQRETVWTTLNVLKSNLGKGGGNDSDEYFKSCLEAVKYISNILLDDIKCGDSDISLIMMKGTKKFLDKVFVDWFSEYLRDRERGSFYQSNKLLEQEFIVVATAQLTKQADECQLVREK